MNLRKYFKKFLALAAGSSLLLSMFANTAFAGGPADLEVTDITLSSSSQLQVHLKNNGASVSQDVGIHIWIDNMSRPEWTYSSGTLHSSKKGFLNSGGTGIISPQPLKGNHLVVACVDQLNVVSESNETNNCAVKRLIGGQELPDLRINSVTFDGNPSKLSDLNMRVTVENRGRKNTFPNDGTIGLWYEAIDQGAAGYYEFPRLDRGQIQTFSIPFNSVENATDNLGSYNRFLFRIDQGSYISVANRMNGSAVNSEIAESNEANNTFTVQIDNGRTINQTAGPVVTPRNLGTFTLGSSSGSGSSTTTTASADLAVTNIYKSLHPSGQLHLAVDVENLGPGMIAVDHGRTKVWVDGELMYNYRWSNLASKSFLSSRGKSTMTPLGFYGISPLAEPGNHVVKVCVDTTDVVPETNEANNCYSKTLNNDPLEDNNGNTITTTNSNGQRLKVGFYGPGEEVGNDYPFKPGAKVHFKLKALEMPSGVAASPARGWMLNNMGNNRHYYQRQPDKMVSVTGYRTEFKNGYWHVYFDAPKYEEGTYVMRFEMYCPAGNNKACNQNTYTSSPMGVHYSVDSDSRLINPTTSTSSNGLRFDVDLVSYPKGYEVGKGQTEIKAKVGDVIKFVRDVDNKNAVNVAWKWNWEPMLDCAPTPAFDSETLKCLVKKDGLSKVSITMYPTTKDGKQHKVNSNVIFVTTGKSNPTPTYGGTGMVSSSDTPAAGYEEDVKTGTYTGNNPFSDTNISSLEGKAAANLYNWGIIGGFPDGEFKGSRSVNRAEAAKFLLLSRYEDIPNNPNNGIFWDVLDGQWYTKYVITAAGLKIINGYSDGSFKPASTVNTAEFLKMLTLTFDLKTGAAHSYKDVDRGAWYAKYAGVAAEYDLFPNRRSDRLEPGRLLTRNEVAVAIYKYLSNR